MRLKWLAARVVDLSDATLGQTRPAILPQYGRPRRNRLVRASAARAVSRNRTEHGAPSLGAVGTAHARHRHFDLWRRPDRRARLEDSASANQRASFRARAAGGNSSSPSDRRSGSRAMAARSWIAPASKSNPRRPRGCAPHSAGTTRPPLPLAGEGWGAGFLKGRPLGRAASGKPAQSRRHSPAKSRMPLNALYGATFSRERENWWRTPAARRLHRRRMIGGALGLVAAGLAPIARGRAEGPASATDATAALRGAMRGRRPRRPSLRLAGGNNPRPRACTFPTEPG